MNAAPSATSGRACIQAHFGQCTFVVRDSHSQCTVKYAVAIINSKHGDIKYTS